MGGASLVASLKFTASVTFGKFVPKSLLGKIDSSCFSNLVFDLLVVCNAISENVSPSPLCHGNKKKKISSELFS